MEKAVLGILLLQVLDSRRLAGGGGADEVMPAEDLMQDDAVEETAQPEPIAGQGVFDTLEKTVESQPLEGQTILEIDASSRAADEVVCAFNVRTNVRGGGMFITRWRGSSAHTKCAAPNSAIAASRTRFMPISPQI